SVYASTWLLPDTLQHSILGSWLAATQVGVSPTCLQLISSTHVHRLVIWLFSSQPVTDITVLADFGNKRINTAF
ncbi:MAG: hypothetical protein ACK57V_20570, partial [Pirellula sp.]